MVNKSFFKIAFLLSQKRLLSGLNAIIVVVYIFLLVFVYLKDSFLSSLQIFLNLFPYLFLIMSRDLLHDDIQSGALENILFIDRKYKPFIIWKVGSTMFLVFILATSIFILYIFQSCLNATFSVDLLYAYCSGLIVGIYLALWGSFLSFYIKGSANVLLILFVQMSCAFLPIIFGADTFRGIFEMIENGVPAVFAKQVMFSAILILLPNLITKSRFVGFIPVVLLLIIVLWVFHLLKLKGLEIIKK